MKTLLVVVTLFASASAVAGELRVVQINRTLHVGVSGNRTDSLAAELFALFRRARLPVATRGERASISTDAFVATDVGALGAPFTMVEFLLPRWDNFVALESTPGGRNARFTGSVAEALFAVLKQAGLTVTTDTVAGAERITLPSARLTCQKAPDDAFCTINDRDS